MRRNSGALIVLATSVRDDEILCGGLPEHLALGTAAGASQGGASRRLAPTALLASTQKARQRHRERMGP